MRSVSAGFPRPADFRRDVLTLSGASTITLAGLLFLLILFSTACGSPGTNTTNLASVNQSAHNTHTLRPVLPSPRKPPLPPPPPPPPPPSGYDGPAELPRVYVRSSLADTPAPGNTIAVNVGDDLQSALDAAACGDTITLAAGGIFSGAFSLPAKGCDDNHWIIIRTSAPDSQLPPEGTRITPCYAGIASLPGRPAFHCQPVISVMPKIVNPTAGTSGPLLFASGATHYRLLGLEITRLEGIGVIYDLASMQHGGPADHIILDRVWMHGSARDETTRGIDLSGTVDAAVVDSFFSDFHCIAITGACGDAQAILGGLGTLAMGPFKIDNNFLEASGQSIMFGGGAAAQTPADIEIRGNYLFKPLIWNPHDPTFFGTTFIVKNGFEFKNAERVLFEGNRIQNDWGGFTQSGFAIVITPKNPGGCPICTVRDITIRYSAVSHAGAAMQIANGLSDQKLAAQEGSHYSVHDVIFDDMNYPTCYDCNGDMFQIGSDPIVPLNFWLHDVAIRHVTVATNQARGGWLISGPIAQPNFTFQDNITDNGKNGNTSAGGGAIQCYYHYSIMEAVLNSCWSPYIFTNNVVMRPIKGEAWPAQNFQTTDGTTVGFVNWNGGIGGDYHLAPSSPFEGTASDGTDPGANIDAVLAALATSY